MIWRLTLRTISVLLLIAFMAACANAEAAPVAQPSIPISTQETINTEVPAVTDTPVGTLPDITDTPAPDAGGATLAGQCVNAYYPIREGSTWMYESTGNTTGSYSFTDTITSVRDNGFSLTTQFADRTQSQEWACTAEGLVAQELGGAPAAALNAMGTPFELTIDHVSGVTFPNSISAGDQWQHNLEFTGKMSMAGQEGQASGTAQSNFTALGVESVTVPAGTFDAMQIEVNSTISIGLEFQGMKVPVSFTGTYTYWFVQGVGWVKASGSGEIAGQSFTEAIELRAYNIP
ncbi:MAG: hypothetical protein ABI621_08865 [Chloroflexota bacterium]